jgi:hypothetical protein
MKVFIFGIKPRHKKMFKCNFFLNNNGDGGGDYDDTNNGNNNNNSNNTCYFKISPARLKIRERN